MPPLPFDPMLDFANRHDTDEEVLRSNPLNPMKQMRIALSWWFAQLGKNDCIEQKH